MECYQLSWDVMSHYDDKSLRNNQGFMVHVSPGLVFVAVAKKSVWSIVSINLPTI